MRSRLFREGSVGLFILLGLFVFGGIIFFLKGYKFQNQSYQLTLLFENAGGLREGGRVFFRGVGVGRIVAIQPSSNGVEIITEINGSLRIPSQVRVSTIRSGLLGDVSVNIIPEQEVSDEGKQINPLSKDCPNQQLILCNQATIKAKASPDLVESLSRLADRFDNDQLFDNINSTIVNMNKASEKVGLLSDNISGFTTQAKRDLGTITEAANQVSNTAKSFSNTAETFSRTGENLNRNIDMAGEQIVKLADDYRNTANQISLLADNMNQVINDNKSSLSDAIVNLSATTANISQLAKNTDKLITRVNSADVEKIAKNIETSSQNLTKISNNLLAISEELNKPSTLTTLQQTLDSARVTFANTAKITSEIEEFTGDPEFRRNLRRLVDGLSSLVSYTELLEKQIELATLLGEVEKTTVNQQLITAKNIKIDLNQQKFPSTIYENR